MLMIVVGLTSCDSWGKTTIKMIPQAPILVIPSEPTVADLASQLPDSIRMDVELAMFYMDACNEYTAERQEYDDYQIYEEYMLTQDEACNWVIDGYTVQDGLTVEYINLQKTDYVERLRAWGQALVRTLEKLQEGYEK
jgi:hypothetical protein